MAKKHRNRGEETTSNPEATEASTEATMTESVENTVETAAEATVTEPKVDERYKFITHPETKQPMKRIDFIRECWEVKKMSRGAIAKLLSELSGKKVPYQIVFSATKGRVGGPPKSEAPAAETSEAAA